MAEELKAVRAAIQQELELARAGEGYEEDAVADGLVELFVKPLLWLHAEAVWNHHLALLEIARANKAWREIVEQWEHGHNEIVMPYTTSLETEIERLQRQLEFEMYGGDNFSGADALVEAVPQCAVHPEGQGEIRSVPWTEADADAFEAEVRAAERGDA